MQPTVKAGIVLGLAAEVWTILTLALGLHQNPMTLLVFYLVILIQAGVLYWGLRMTAAQGKTYGGQVVSGLIISAIGAAIIFVGSIIITSYIFPNYFMEVEEGLRTFLQSQGLPEADIQMQIDSMASSNTPLQNAINGVIGTLVTGLILSLIIGAFVKAKPGAETTTEETAS